MAGSTKPKRAKRTQIEGIAALLADKRSRFREVFDRVRVEQRATTDEFKFLAIGLEGPEALATALGAAQADGWYEPLLRALVASGLDTEPAEQADGSWAPTELQGMVSGPLGFTQVAEASQAILRFTRQLCRVDIDGDPIGTGFLVGPHMVLTSWHVVADLITQAKPRKGSARDLRLVFDDDGAVAAVTYSPVDDWLFAHEPGLDNERTAVPERLNPLDADVSQAKDYAVIELSSCPGYERGWVDFTDIPEFSHGTLKGCTVLQHPNGQPQRLAPGMITGLRDGSGGTRLLYTANTGKGSSGGLVVDHRYRVVGLHQGEIVGQNVNTGIVAHCIAEQLAAAGRLVGLVEPAPGRAQVYRRIGDEGPIIGRAESQSQINRLRIGDQRILMVSSASPRMGKSFTLDLLKACLPRTQHTFGLVTAKTFPGDALGAAATVLDSLGLPAGGLPPAASVDSGSDTWIKALVAEVAFRLAANSGDVVRWLVIDELTGPLSDGGGRRFLSQLYTELPAIPLLRIVLIGLRTTLDGIDAKMIATDDIGHPTEAELRGYVQAAYVQRGMNFAYDEVRRTARLALLSGGSGIVDLAKFVSGTLDRMISDDQANV